MSGVDPAPIRTRHRGLTPERRDALVALLRAEQRDSAMRADTLRGPVVAWLETGGYARLSKPGRRFVLLTDEGRELAERHEEVAG